MKEFLRRFVEFLKSLSFKTGIIVAGISILCYAVSFGQMLLPIPLVWKTGLWVAFFGLAKAAQYTSILILGKEGIRRLKSWFNLKSKSQV